jgi:hypothetical protein
MEHHLHSAWEVIKAIVVTLGGLAGVIKIFEWLFSGPKIIGRVEQTMSADEKKPDGSHVGAAFFYLIYLVNKRVDPTTIQGFEISAKVGDKWVVGRVVHIVEGLDLPLPDGAPKINLSDNRLYEKVALNLLEYGKGVRGWMQVQFLGRQRDDLRESKLRIELTDAFGKKHVVHDKHKNYSSGMHYYPGAGISYK